MAPVSALRPHPVIVARSGPPGPGAALTGLPASRKRLSPPAGGLLRAFALSILSGTAFLAIPLQAQAQSVWTGAVSDDWFDPANWANAAVPTAADAAVVEGNIARIAGFPASAADLAVGASAAGQLDVVDGLATGMAVIGATAGTPGMVNVNGDRADWQNTGNMAVGDQGTGSLNINGGGAVSTATAVVGTAAGSTGAVSLDGTGSRWTVGDQLTLGDSGAGAVTVTGGSTVTAGNTTLGGRSTGTGWASIFGAGSSLDAGELVVGADGTGTVEVSAGGSLVSATAEIGAAATSRNNSVTVTGDGSTWTSTGPVAIGTAGDGRLRVVDGASVTGTSAALGLAAGGTGTATVEGRGSLWSLSGQLGVGGDAASPATAGGAGDLTLVGGGRVEAGSAAIGGSLGSTGTVAVSGGASAADGVTASTLSVSGNLGVGSVGTGALDISSGGQVETGSATIGAAAGAVGVATVAGNDTRWNNAGALTIGDSGSGQLSVAAGGTVSSENSSVGDGATGDGRLAVGGNGSAFATSAGLTVGRQGSGALAVTTGGAVTAGSVVLGAETGAVGAAAIDGDGSVLAAQEVVVGGAGTGALTLSGSGTLAAETVTIAESAGSTGTLNLGAAAGAPPVEGGVLDADRVVFGGGNGSLVINTAGATNQITADISGAGSVVQEAGDTVLAGDSSFSGGTSVRGGSLTLAGSMAAGTGTISLGDDTRLTLVNDLQLANALAIDGRTALAVATGTATASGPLTGVGDLTLDGAGTLVLSGNGSAYAGAASLTDGTLVVDGSLGGTLDVSAGGTLAGNGTVGDTRIGDGGTLAPGQLSIAGDVTFNPGSVLQVEVSGSGQSGRVEASGLATINGGLLAVVALDPAISYSAGQRFTVLSAAGGVTGRFDGTSFSSAFLDARLGYDANGVILTVTPDAPRDTLFADAAATFNQRAAARALDGFDQAAGSDAIIVYNQLLFSANAADAQRAFDLTSGEVHASAQTAIAGASQLFTASLRDRAALTAGAQQTPYGGSAATPPPLAAGVWGGTMAESARHDGDGNAARLSADTAGVLGGAEVNALDLGSLGGLTVGFGFGFSRTDADIVARLSETDIDSGHAGLYAALENGPLLLTSAVAYGHHSLDTRRRIAFGTIDRLAESRTSAESFSYAGEAQLRVPLGGLMVTPLATLNLHKVLVDGTDESNAGALSLATEDADATSGDVGIGLALGYGWSIGSGRLRSDIRAAYEKGFGSAPEQTLSFLGGPVQVAVRGADGREDRLAVGVGIAAELTNGLVFSGRYDGSFGSEGDSHGGYLAAGYRF